MDSNEALKWNAWKFPTKHQLSPHHITLTHVRQSKQTRLQLSLGDGRKHMIIKTNTLFFFTLLAIIFSANSQTDENMFIKVHLLKKFKICHRDNQSVNLFIS